MSGLTFTLTKKFSLLAAVALAAGLTLKADTPSNVPMQFSTAPNPEVLRWQFEAQERERAINRDRDIQLAHAAAQAPQEPQRVEVRQ